jgi:thiol:disulfide interchange protein
VNLFIGALFLFFAFNLFGFYEISIPASVLTKLDSITRSEEGKGSAYLGALLMGLTFTLTSFTCTSPFIGSLLVSTAQGRLEDAAARNAHVLDRLRTSVLCSRDRTASAAFAA